MRNQEREQRSVNSQGNLKVLDFGTDNDQKPDNNGERTGASLNAGPLPPSFTICSALMVDAWPTKSARMFTLLDAKGQWGYIHLSAALTYTQYDVKLGPVFFVEQRETVFFPLQWTRACLSLDSSKVVVVVDGQLLGEREYRREEDTDRLDDLNLRLGVNFFGYEDPAKIANLNVFNSSLLADRMVGLTSAGEEECGAAGDLVSWEEAEWTLHSQARVIEVDKKWEGPCRRESQVQIFMAIFEEHRDCMHHCKKVVDGRSPPVTTEEEWENLKAEIDLITEVRSSIPQMWISATKGDKDGNLARLDHWPETEVVKNEIKKLEAEVAVWRDFYTGQRLDDWTKPFWYSTRDLDDVTMNCMGAYTDVPWAKSWDDTWPCFYYLDQSCPCIYRAQPLLRMRGLCSPLIDGLFSPKQLPGNPRNMILMGAETTRIEYDDESSKWTLKDSLYDVTAVSYATKLSYVIGKHEWTISNDVYKCGNGQPYTTMLKLTGCKEEEFTCDDGQCIAMERRCDQVTGKEPNCRDKSDENGCQLVVFENNYNKNVPPIGQTAKGEAIPANVSISITLMMVVEIQERDHSIALQFEINLQWRENRATYQNLKDKTSLNALTNSDIEMLWLPLIIFDNTDQKQSTRLGWINEWVTGVSVVKEGDFTRSGLEEVDEAEIFKGDENNLTMVQTYTREFQCHYMLQRYPFDTQVKKLADSVKLIFDSRNALLRWV